MPAAEVRLAVGGDIERVRALRRRPRRRGRQPTSTIRVLGTSMLYTSGTTGRPKGVHRPPVPATDGALFGYRGGRGIHLCTGPLYHAAPLAFSLAAPLNAGVGVVLMDHWSADETLRLIEQHADHPQPHGPDDVPPAAVAARPPCGRPPTCRRCSSCCHGAAPCPVAVKQAIIDWWGPVLFEYYAATEGLGHVGHERPVAGAARHRRPEPGAGLRAHPRRGGTGSRSRRDRSHLPAEPGRRAKFDYYKDPAKTESSFDGDHFTLGDVGYLDEDGWLFLTDRSANLIISGGVNIYPAEVEAELLGHPAVGRRRGHRRARRRVGRDRHRRRRAPARRRAHRRPRVPSSSRFCRDRLAHYKCPRRVDFTAELPQTRQRQALQAPPARPVPRSRREIEGLSAERARSSSGRAASVMRGLQRRRWECGSPLAIRLRRVATDAERSEASQRRR